MSSYQERIERYLERHPGATLAEARGHGTTPEHPGAGRGQERFAEYYQQRDALEAHVNSLKQDAYGNLPKFNAEGSAENTSRMSMSALQQAQGFDSIDEMEEYYEDDLDDGYGYYH
jgi:hypothetical protein